MKLEEALELLKNHNDMINNFIKSVPALLGYREDATKISMNDWFSAQNLIKKQNFYEKANKLQKELRSKGFDIKQDMQSNKLIIYGYEFQIHYYSDWG